MDRAASTRPRVRSGEPWARLAWAALGAAALGAALLLGAATIVALGLFDATATTAHNPVLAWVLHRSFVQSVRHRAGRQALPLARADPTQGATLYVRHCAVCHGGLASPRARWVSGLTPTPPYLLDEPGRWSPAELHWIVSRGVKMTGMPAWSETLDDREIWDLVAFLETVPQIRPNDYLRIAAGVRPR